MNTKRLLPFALAAIVAGGLTAGIARAAEQAGEENGADAAALAGTKVTLAQAIASVEQQTGGKAVGADLVTGKGPSHFAVEVAGPQGVKTMTVDAQTGQVTAAAAGTDGGEEAEASD